MARYSLSDPAYNPKAKPKTQPSSALKDLSVSLAGGKVKEKKPTTPAPVRRYTSLYEQEAGQKPASFSQNDADKIRRNRYSQAQGQIDGINQVFDQKLAEAKQEGKVNLGRTRAISGRGGLTGSGRGEAMRQNTLGANKQQEDSVEAQRMQKIDSIFADVDSRADSEIEARRLEAAGNQTAYVDFLKNQKENASLQMDELAGLGVTIDEISPEDKEDFLKYTGLDEMTFTTMWNKKLPKEAQTDYKFDVTPQGVLAYGINPKTGELDTKTFAMPSELAPGEELKEFDGVLYATSRGADGKVVLRPLAQAKPKADTTVPGTYVPGADPVVDSWVAQIKAGKTKITSVPKEYKNKVIVALEQATGTTLTSDIETAEEIQRLAQEMRDDEATLGNVVGPISSKTPTLRGASATYEAKLTRLKALISKANLATMRGLGSMSNIEFENMQAIGSALATSMGEEGFKGELDRIIEVQKKAVGESRKNVPAGGSAAKGSVTAETLDQYLEENPEEAERLASQVTEDMSDEEVLYLINGQ